MRIAGSPPKIRPVFPGDNGCLQIEAKQRTKLPITLLRHHPAGLVVEVRSEEMAPTTFSERVATAERTLDWFKRNRADLDRLGLRADLWIQNLENSIETAKATDNRQELLKAELHATTEALERVDATMYRVTSSAIDAGIGAYGKGSEPAKQLAGLRSQVRRGTQDEEDTPPAAKPGA